MKSFALYRPSNSNQPSESLLPIISLTLFVAPIISFIISIVNMARAFSVLREASETASIDGIISQSLTLSMIGVVLGVIGYLAVYTCVKNHSYTSDWFPRWVKTFSIFWGFCYIPVGIVFGILMIRMVDKVTPANSN